LTVTDVEVEYVLEAFPAKVTLVPEMAVIACPSKTEPMLTPVGTLATVTALELVLLLVTVTV
jgi:hypothetical protein